jgi:signal transduction histidine kinase
VHLERWLAIHLLGAEIPPLTRTSSDAGFFATAISNLGNAAFWKGLALLIIKLPLTIVAMVLALVPAALTIAFALAPVVGISNLHQPANGWGFDLTPSGAWVTGLMAIPSAVVTIGVLDGIRAVLKRVTTFLLSSPPPADRMVRESLAEGLGDESLTVAYWLPEREVFVDDQGREVNVSEIISTGRVWTPVGHDGKLIAAIIHRPDLANSGIVQTAGTAAVLQLENERLRADLRARLDELRASRARIVEVSDAERRRLERNLHDGAQQQLVALALQLRMARSKTTDEEGGKLIDDALEQLNQALSDLRELARGIHPAILSDRGLEAAVSALAERQPLPTEISCELSRPLEETVQATAYFVVAEGLANIVKHAEAKAVAVEIKTTADALEVEVRDDGKGGVDPGKGTGLRGLEERLRALDGTLRIESSEGVGTRLLARIPLAAVEVPPDAEPAGQE